MLPLATETVTYEEAKQTTLAYYIAKRDSLPLPMRDMPRKIVANQSLSINAIIANIESNTEIGQWLVGEYVSSLELIVSE